MQQNLAAGLISDRLTGTRRHQSMQSHGIRGPKREDATASNPECTARSKEKLSSLVDKQRPGFGVKQDHAIIKMVQNFRKTATLGFQATKLQAHRHGALKMGSEQAAEFNLILLKLLCAMHPDHDP